MEFHLLIFRLHIYTYILHIAFAGNGYIIGKQSTEESKINDSPGMCEFDRWAVSSSVVTLVLQ